MTRRMVGLMSAAVLVGSVLAGASPARAHCDTLDGPVVIAAQKALTAGEVSPVLMWVHPEGEAEVKAAFQQALSVRKLSPEAKELADRYFFETLVRVHRAGEGAPYTGLKPAGLNLGAAIPAADKAVETGSLEPVMKVIHAAVEGGLHHSFERVLATRKYEPGDAEAGRRFVAAYVTFLHYVEGVHQAAERLGAEHGEHAAAPAATCGAAHAEKH